MSSVIAEPTRPNGEQAWRCQGCGARVAYSQPINFRLALDILQPFMDFHAERCGPEQQRKEVASDSPLAHQQYDLNQRLPPFTEPS